MMSALPRKADITGRSEKRPLMTQSGRSLDCAIRRASKLKTVVFAPVSLSVEDRMDYGMRMGRTRNKYPLILR